MIDTVNIGKIIQKLRIERKITQEFLAEQIGISKNYLSKVERGLSKLNVEAFLKMAQILDFEISDFNIKTGKTMKTDINRDELLKIILTSNSKEIETYLKLIKVLKESK
ncbi:MAG: helix-turn-helix domain-containing protein [Candidatus Gastranaerophilales bacterium]|nr:helix-turn-helix domain-containing protein [Candidatus Gastranaerophilales bacterium]